MLHSSSGAIQGALRAAALKEGRTFDQVDYAIWPLLRPLRMVLMVSGVTFCVFFTLARMLSLRRWSISANTDRSRKNAMIFKKENSEW